MKRFIAMLFAVLMTLSLAGMAVCSSGEGGDSPGGGDSSGGGNAGSAASAAATRQVMAAAAIYINDGDCGKFMPVAKTNLDRMDEGEKGGIMCLMAKCYFKGNNYDQGKALIMTILKTQYDSVTELLGDREKVRTLASAIFADEAGKRGKAEDIQEVQKLVDKDSTLDRLLVRDGDGSLVSRTKLSYVLSFHEAQAYKNSDRAKQALSILRELSFSSGKIMVDGKIEGLRDAVDRMTAEIQATALRWLNRVIAS
nr:hypothetical protein [uncultured Dethiosulfovibrio sp.]